MKKKLFLILCFLISFALSGCSKNPVVSEESDGKNELTEAVVKEEEPDVAENKEDASFEEAEKEADVTENKEDGAFEEADPDKSLPSESEENAVREKIYEGRYFDEGVYQYIDIPESESPLIYCEVLISNVTDTSLDFIINEKVMATGESSVLVPAGTAMLEEKEAKAVYHGENLTLTFDFTNEPELFPKHLKVSGLEQMEGKSYVNNTIPGHESG